MLSLHFLSLSQPVRLTAPSSEGAKAPTAYGCTGHSLLNMVIPFVKMPIYSILCPVIYLI